MRLLPILGLATFLLLAAGFNRAADPAPDMTHEILRTLSMYPKAEREAILDLAGHPALIKKLDPKAKGAALEKILEGQPQAVKDAVTLLMKYPAIIELLKDDPDHYAPAGKEFAKDKKKLGEQMDQEEKDTAKATDEWAQRLEGDQEALEQLLDAEKIYAKEPHGAVVDSGVGASGTDVNVYSLPSPGFINYVMTNADRYPILSDTMVSQWLSSKNSAAYDRTFHHWWHRYDNHFNDSLLKHDESRSHRLSELARFDRQHIKVDAAHRYENFEKHAKDFPHLGKLPKRDPNHPLLAHGRKPDHKDGHPAGKNPHRAAGKAGAMHHAVHRKAGSQHHQMHHAVAGHRHHAAAHHHGGGHRK